MVQQNKESRAVPQGRRKAVGTQGIERTERGKATPVKKQMRQLELRIGTAEELKLQDGSADGEEACHQRRASTYAEPKPVRKNRRVSSATMEEVVLNLRPAFEKVASNKGSSGPDGQTIEEVREHLDEVLTKLSRELLEGTYKPGGIRRVWIPKGEGGQRGLGIPNVADRIVQDAVRMELEPLYEPMFYEQSHGFRPGRSCHTAMAEAKKHVEEGYEWVVDLDIEKFFDRVNHQRLMARLSQRVEDRRMLVLIGRMLKAEVIMPDGVVVSTEEGVPQGGPLSPLLSNIVLDELDAEVNRRGHRYVRYADDCNIYVRSERAGQRVMASIVAFIKRKLRLKVNEAKSAVARTGERHFLGFSLRPKPEDGEVEVTLSKRSKERMGRKIQELIPRNAGNSLREVILQINRYLKGWIGFYGICTVGTEKTLVVMDAHIRRRLRALQLKQWKRKLTIVKRLIRLGVSSKTAWRNVYGGRKSTWALSHCPAVERGLRNAYFAERGLESLAEMWRRLHLKVGVPVQLELQLG